MSVLRSKIVVAMLKFATFFGGRYLELFMIFKTEGSGKLINAVCLHNEYFFFWNVVDFTGF